MSDALKAKILQTVSLVDIISERVELSARGNLKIGRCPFHEEKTGSFTVYPDHYYCFGCKESGDAISFVRKTRDLSFIDALKYLGQKCGIDTTSLDKTAKSRDALAFEARLFACMSLAQDFFVRTLRAPAHRVRVDYLKGRGFDEEQITKFGLGYAPDDMRSLHSYLRGQGFDNREIDACSLSVNSSKNPGQVFDFFRNRIMIPIRDVSGRLVAFGGRACDDFPPKYKNSRETLIFDKSNTLFGFDRARDAIREGQSAIVVEGYMDVLALWAAGFRGAVACMGTALKHAHLKQLNAVSSKVFLVFDGDQAGNKATLATMAIALNFPRLEVLAVTLPEGDDPDTFVQHKGSEQFKALLAQSRPLLDVALDAKLDTARSMGAIARVDWIRQEILPWMRQIQDGMQRDLILNRLSFIAGVSRSALDAELSANSSARPSPSSNPTENARKSQAELEGAVVSADVLVRELEVFEMEYLGHLFFAKPGDFQNLNLVVRWIQTNFDEQWIWAEFAEDLQRCLLAGLCPAEATDRSSWRSIAHPAVAKLIDHLRDSAMAFDSRDRQKSIDQLQQKSKVLAIKKEVSMLRKNLGLQADESQTIQTLSRIKELNTQLSAIESAQKSP